MEIEIKSCQDCPFGEQHRDGTFNKCRADKNMLWHQMCHEDIPIFCPLRQDNIITFKLKEDDKYNA